jgi:hypothetical protein
MTTKREQVEAVLKARGLRERRSGDWLGAGAYVRLDIRYHPGCAWYSRVYNGLIMPSTELLTYDEVIARFE